MRPKNPKDTDYDVRELLTKRELQKFHGEDTKDPRKIAVLESRQQDRERRKSRNEKVPDRPDDVPPSRYEDIHGRRPIITLKGRRK